MKWHEPLDDILGSRAKVRILRVLWASQGDAFSGREIARRTGLSHTGVLRALGELEEQDVVWPSTDVTGTRYRLNRTHAFVRDGLCPLFEMEASVGRRLATYVLEAVPQALAVVVFGSVARGEDSARSDVDVLVVVPDDADPIDCADRLDGVEFYARLGKLLMPIIWSETELADAIANGLPLVENILREGKLVAGEPLITIATGRAARAAG